MPKPVRPQRQRMLQPGAGRPTPVNRILTMIDERCCDKAALELRYAHAAQTETHIAPAGAHAPGLKAGPSVVMTVASARDASHGAPPPLERKARRPQCGFPAGPAFPIASSIQPRDRTLSGFRRPLDARAPVSRPCATAGSRPRTTRLAQCGLAARTGRSSAAGFR